MSVVKSAPQFGWLARELCDMLGKARSGICEYPSTRTKLDERDGASLYTLYRLPFLVPQNLVKRDQRS